MLILKSFTHLSVFFCNAYKHFTLILGGGGIFYYFNLHNRQVIFCRKVKVQQRCFYQVMLLFLYLLFCYPAPIFFISVHLLLVNLFDLNTLFNLSQTFSKHLSTNIKYKSKTEA